MSNPFNKHNTAEQPNAWSGLYAKITGQPIKNFQTGVTETEVAFTASKTTILFDSPTEGYDVWVRFMAI